MRIREFLLIGLLVCVGVGSILIYARPSTTSYSVVNYGDDGLSKLKEFYKASVITDMSVVRGANTINTAYLIIRSSNMSLSDVEILKQLISNGGYVIVSGSPEFIMSLSNYMGLNLSVTDNVIYDMIYNGGNRFYPRGFSSYCNTTLTTYKPYYVLFSKAEVVAYSSNFSYVDLNGNGYMDIEESLGSFPLGVLISFGEGYLILVFSPQVFTNKLFESNKDFINCIVGNRKLVIDQSEVRKDFIEYVRILTSPREASYTVLFLLIFVLCVVTYYVFKGR